MYAPSYSQNTAENVLRGYDFGNQLQEDETISTFSRSAVDQNGVDQTSLVAAVSYGQKIAYYRITGGASGLRLFVTLTITTSAGNTLKGYVYVDIFNK